jgi:hypothetical protein
MKPVLAAARQSRVYHIILSHGDSLAAVVIVFRDRTHQHRPSFDPGAGVVDVVGGLHTEVVALVSLAQEVGLGLGGIRQPGGPGPTLHVVVAQAGLAVLPITGVRHSGPWREPHVRACAEAPAAGTNACKAGRELSASAVSKNGG